MAKEKINKKIIEKFIGRPEDIVFKSDKKKEQKSDEKPKNKIKS